jgi:toxin ParE1/3/4
MSSYKVIYTKRAENDLKDIFEYIAFSLSEPNIAKNQVNHIMDSINDLDNMPLRYQLHETEPWHSKGIRRLPVDKFVVFYLTVESSKTVAIIRIMYGGRDVDKELAK